MAFALTLLFSFFAIFQPGVLWPGLAVARPVILTILLATLATFAADDRNKALYPRPVLSYFIIGFVAAQILSVIQFFYIPTLIETSIKWITFGSAYLLISTHMQSTGRIKVFWGAILIAGVFLVGQAGWIYHHADLSHPQLTGGRLSSYGAYSGANDLALLVVIIWPILFKFLDLNRNLVFKLILIPALLLLIYVDLRTLSRAGLIGLSLVMGLSMLRGRSLGKLGRWALLVPAVVVIFILGSKLLLTRSDAQDFSGHDESVQHRYDAWYAGGQMLKSSPIWGVGEGNFPSLARRFGAGRRIQAHNTIVKVFAESGMIGGFCYLGALFMAFKLLWRNWRRFSKIKPDGPEVLWAEALGIALIGFFFNTLFSVKAHEWLLYMILATTLAIDRLYPREALIYALKVEKALELAGGGDRVPELPREPGTKSA